MRVYAVQFAIAWENPTTNFQRVTRLLSHANIAPNSLIILPEMFATGFSMHLPLTTAAQQQTRKFLAKLAKRFDSAVLGGLTAQAPAPHLHKGLNQALALAPDGSLLNTYNKIHPFSYGQESAHFIPGNAITTFTWQKFTICPFICYDLRFPEIFRLALRQGTNLFTLSANWPAARTHHWLTLLQARAIENQSYVVGVNCLTDPQSPKTLYDGQSRIFDPQGNPLATAEATPTVLTANLSLPKLRQYRREFPALADLHPEFLNLPLPGTIEATHKGMMPQPQRFREGSDGR